MISKNAAKAKRRMVAFYGAAEGNRIFIEYAKVHGKGKSLSAKIRNAYRKRS